MVPDHLLQIATDLAEINTRRPRRTDLCRALSTVYYALFHCLARTCADSMAGRSWRPLPMQASMPRRRGWRSSDAAAGVPGSGAQAGQDAMRECAVLASRRDTGVRGDVRSAAEQTPFCGLRSRLPGQEVGCCRGHQGCTNSDRPLSRSAGQRPTRLRHPCADEGESGRLNPHCGRSLPESTARRCTDASVAGAGAASASRLRSPSFATARAKAARRAGGALWPTPSNFPLLWWFPALTQRSVATYVKHLRGPDGDARRR